MQENVTPTHLIGAMRPSYSPYVTHNQPQPDMVEVEIRHEREWRLRLETENEELRNENAQLKARLAESGNA